MPMVRRFIPHLCGLLLCGLTSIAVAAELPSYHLPKGEKAEGQILANNGGKIRPVTIAEIEALPMVELEGRASPEEPLTRFQGVLLKDVLKLIGADGVDEVTVRASDDYAAEIPREDWERWPIILATRTGGKLLTTRQRGPARILYPTELFPETTERAYADRSVWLISEIQW